MIVGYQVLTMVLLASFVTLVSCVAYSLTLNMEATCSTKMSVGFQRTSWYYIPENRTRITLSAM
jgi:hypothetical protein